MREWIILYMNINMNKNGSYKNRAQGKCWRFFSASSCFCVCHQLMTYYHHNRHHNIKTVTKRRSEWAGDEREIFFSNWKVIILSHHHHDIIAVHQNCNWIKYCYYLGSWIMVYINCHPHLGEVITWLSNITFQFLALSSSW